MSNFDNITGHIQSRDSLPWVVTSDVLECIHSLTSNATLSEVFSFHWLDASLGDYHDASGDRELSLRDLLRSQGKGHQSNAPFVVAIAFTDERSITGLTELDVGRMRAWIEARFQDPALPALIVVSPVEIPEAWSALREYTTLISFPLPNLEMRERILANLPDSTELAKKSGGLSGTRLRALVRLIETNPALVPSELIKREVSAQVQRTGVLEVRHLDSQLTPQVHGMAALKQWISEEVHEWMSAPGKSAKGMLLAGMSGCGKSEAAQATANWLKLPLYRLDMSRILAQYVGNSERNLRHAFEILESVAPCVLWIDEIEKAFAGSKDGHETSVRLTGMFLTWMQENTKAIFVVATANSIDKLPTELFRSGRFDRQWRVGPPNKSTVMSMMDEHALEGRTEDLADQIVRAKAVGSDVVAIISQIRSKGTQHATAIVEEFKTLGKQKPNLFDNYYREFFSGAWHDVSGEGNDPITGGKPFVTFDLGGTRTKIAVWPQSHYPQAFDSVNFFEAPTARLLNEDGFAHIGRNLIEAVPGLKELCNTADKPQGVAFSVSGNITDNRYEGYLIDRLRLPANKKKEAEAFPLNLCQELGIPLKAAENDGVAWTAGLHAIAKELNLDGLDGKFLCLGLGTGVAVSMFDPSLSGIDQYRTQANPRAVEYRSEYKHLQTVCGNEEIARGRQSFDTEVGSEFLSTPGWQNHRWEINGRHWELSKFYTRRVIALAADLSTILKTSSVIISGGGPSTLIKAEEIEGVLLHNHGIKAHIIQNSLRKQGPLKHRFPYSTSLIPLFGAMRLGLLA